MAGPDGPIDITDYEYKENFGDELPEEPEFHDEGFTPWTYFWRLHGRRGPGFGGPAAITYTEIRNWSELTRTFISPRDVELITLMDEAYMRAWSEGEAMRKKREDRKRKK